MKKIRLGIVGCGIAARELHFPALNELKDLFEITAVTSRTRKHAEEFARLVGNPMVFDSFDELLDSELIDAVDLTLPVELNVPFTEKAVFKKKHVICEKPISINVENGKRLVDLYKKTSQVIYIAENWRHIKKFYKIKDQLYKIGKPLFFTWNIWVRLDVNNKYVRTEWRQKPKHIGGFLSDAGVHHVAAMRLLFGDIKWVSAVDRKHSDYLGDSDFLSALFEFGNNVIGNYVVSYSINGEEKFEIIGDKGKIKLIENKIIVNEEVIEIEDGLGYKEEFEDFYKVVMGEKENNLGSPFEALKDLAFFEAALKSKGNKVNISDII
ncbi:MAG: Gfo/Idh/MocA family oxidoreductase [Thermosipho sp. (in: Bacteria)]|nr:Gfo/Idh/MocA family oxidoreductase [Thermosipho sp. (in: thermotogales)]